jgi:2-keto-3-deoxy-L-rhamnonate aldolase RhmA
LPYVQYRKLSAPVLYDTMNRSVAVKVLIESALGIANIEAIASVPGVDFVGIGTNDLSAELGVPGEFRHAKVRAAHEAALAGCKRAGKPLAIGGVPDLAYGAELIRMGAAPFLMTAIDTDLLLAAATERVTRALESITT